MNDAQLIRMGWLFAVVALTIGICSILSFTIWAVSETVHRVIKAKGLFAAFWKFYWTVYRERGRRHGKGPNESDMEK